MSKRIPQHRITETRDWARIVLSAGLALAFVILAVRGELDVAALVAAFGNAPWLRP